MIKRLKLKKVEGTASELRKFSRSGYNYSSFRVNKQLVTINTENSTLDIENGDLVIAVGEVDDVGNLDPYIFSNETRNIYIDETSQYLLWVLYIIFFAFLAVTIFALGSYAIYKYESLDKYVMFFIFACQLWAPVFIWKVIKAILISQDQKKMQAMMQGREGILTSN